MHASGVLGVPVGCWVLLAVYSPPFFPRLSFGRGFVAICHLFLVCAWLKLSRFLFFQRLFLFLFLPNRTKHRHRNHK